jgi:hypothetical protein
MRKNTGFGSGSGSTLKAKRIPNTALQGAVKVSTGKNNLRWGERRRTKFYYNPTVSTLGHRKR